MVELYKLTGDKDKLAEYERRQTITRESLPLLLTPAGYFVKTVEPGGIKHGVLGQEQFGYLEGVANADAVALRVVDDATAATIYDADRRLPGDPALRLPPDQRAGPGRHLLELGQDARAGLRRLQAASAIGSTAAFGARSKAGPS